MNHSEQVGRTWNSNRTAMGQHDGQRRIIHFHEPQKQFPDGCFEIKTEGYAFNELLRPELLERQVQYDEAGHATMLRDQAADEAKKQAEAAEYARYQGFLETMSPMQSGKIRKALEVPMRIEGMVKTRKDIVLDLIAGGATLEAGRLQPQGSRGYYTAASITKAAIDFATHLLKVAA